MCHLDHTRWTERGTHTLVLRWPQHIPVLFLGASLDDRRRKAPQHGQPREKNYHTKGSQQVCGKPEDSGVLKGPPDALSGLLSAPKPSDLQQSPCIHCMRSGIFWSATVQGLEAADVVLSMRVLSQAPNVGRGELVQRPQ